MPVMPSKIMFQERQASRGQSRTFHVFVQGDDWDIREFLLMHRESMQVYAYRPCASQQPVYHAPVAQVGGAFRCFRWQAFQPSRTLMSFGTVTIHFRGMILKQDLQKVVGFSTLCRPGVATAPFPAIQAIYIWRHIICFHVDQKLTENVRDGHVGSHALKLHPQF